MLSAVQLVSNGYLVVTVYPSDTFDLTVIVMFQIAGDIELKLNASMPHHFAIGPIQHEKSPPALRLAGFGADARAAYDSAAPTALT